MRSGGHPRKRPAWVGGRARTWSGEAGEAPRRKEEGEGPGLPGRPGGTPGGEAVRNHLTLTLMTFTPPLPVLPSLPRCLALGQGPELLDTVSQLHQASSGCSVHWVGEVGRSGKGQPAPWSGEGHGGRWVVTAALETVSSGPQDETKAGGWGGAHGVQGGGRLFAHCLMGRQMCSVHAAPAGFL